MNNPTINLYKTYKKLHTLNTKQLKMFRDTLIREGLKRGMVDGRLPVVVARLKLMEKNRTSEAFLNDFRAQFK